MAIPIHKQKGFSLLEALIAMVVISTGLLGVAGFQGALFKNKTESKQQNEAISAAQQKIERFRGFGSLADFDQFTCAVPTDCQETITGTTTTYTRSWTYAPNASSASTPFKTVTVHVQWTTPRGESRSVSLNTLIARRDPTLSGLIAASGVGAPPSTGGGTSPPPPVVTPPPSEPPPSQPPGPVVPPPPPPEPPPAPPTPPQLTFTITASNFTSNPSLSVTINTANGSTTGASCGSVRWESFSSGEFLCTVPATWSGSVIVTGGGSGANMSRICPGNGPNNKTYPFSNVTTNRTTAITVRKGNNSC